MIYLYAALRQQGDNHIFFGVHDEAQFQRIRESQFTHEQAAGSINDLMSSIDKRDLRDPALIEKILVWCSIVSTPHVTSALQRNIAHPHVLVMIGGVKDNKQGGQVDVNIEVFNGPDAEADTNALAHFKSRFDAWRTQ